jgi:cytochrome c oxidase subunit 2
VNGLSGLLWKLNLLLGAEAGGSFWFPRQASEAAPHIDWIYNYVLYICTFFFLLIVGLMIYMVVRFRAREGWAPQPSPDHNRALEVLWTGIPVGLVISMFYLGITAYMDARTPPENALEIQVKGQKWFWSFTYPNGFESVPEDDTHPAELHVPPNEAIRIVLTSDDVIHGFFIPAFRLKMDVVPGRYNKIWFCPTQPGEYPIFCSVYCGTRHSEMRSWCIVHKSRAEYEEWLAAARQKTEGKLTPAQRGRRIYAGKGGCAQCHSLEERVIIGPPFKDLWGKTERLADRSAVPVDEAYVRESILHPSAKLVAGFENLMPPYLGRLKDNEINDIIEFMKSQSKHYTPPPEAPRPQETPAAQEKKEKPDGR